MCVFRERLSFFCVCSSFHFDFEGGTWDLIVLIPDHCLSIYFDVSLCESAYLMRDIKQ